MIKLVASDIDGTLLPDKTKPLDEEIFVLIRELKRRGIAFMAASGRQYPNLKNLFAPVQDEIAYLCANGCLIYENGTLIHKETMSRELGQEIIRTIEEKPGDDVVISGEHACYIDGKNPAFTHEVRDVVKNVTVIPENILDTREDYFKISAHRDAGGLQEIAYYERLFGRYATVVYGGNGYIDMMPRHVNKGTSIQWYMNHCGLKKKETAAFGDNYNDEEMLNNVEYSFAMRKAPREIREFCYGVTDSVTETLRKLLDDSTLTGVSSGSQERPAGTDTGQKG